MYTPKTPFQIEEHTADIQVIGYGTTQKELIHNTSLSLWHIMEPVYADASITNPVPVAVYADNLSHVLVDFLSDILAYTDAHNVAYEIINISELTNTRCIATISGYPIKRFAGTEIKAVTYHHALVTYQNGTWQSRIIYDI